MIIDSLLQKSRSMSQVPLTDSLSFCLVGLGAFSNGDRIPPRHRANLRAKVSSKPQVNPMKDDAEEGAELSIHRPSLDCLLARIRPESFERKISSFLPAYILRLRCTCYLVK